MQEKALKKAGKPRSRGKIRHLFAGTVMASGYHKNKTENLFGKVMNILHKLFHKQKTVAV